MGDAFDEFRNEFGANPATPKSTPELVVNNPTRSVYEAFGTKDKILRLNLRCTGSGMGHCLQYGYITNISYNLRDYSVIFLTVSGLTVTITGTNLKPVLDALNLHSCDFIQEYSAAEFSEPSDKNTPLVSKIEVNVIRAAARATG